MPEIKVRGSDVAGLAREVLSKGGTLGFKARGTSMFPLIKDGDTLVVRSVPMDRLTRGAVAFYQLDNGRLLAHRIVETCCEAAHSTLMVRAETARGPADKIDAAQVLGQVVAVIRKGRRLNLERGFPSIEEKMWTGLNPALRIFVQSTRVLRKILAFPFMVVQSFRWYRVLARQSIGNRVRYRTAVADDARELAATFGFGRSTDVGDPIDAAARQLEKVGSTGYTFVATLDNSIVGWLSAAPPQEDLGLDTYWQLTGMSVRVRYRGSGIGRGLLIMAAYYAQARGAQRLFAVTSEDNSTTLTAGKSLGSRCVTFSSLEDRLRDAFRQQMKGPTMLTRSIKDGLKALDDKGILQGYRDRGCHGPGR
jgi:signal peptidase